MQIYRRVAILELDYRSVCLSLPHFCDFNGGVDAHNFYESSFWKDSDSKSGLGGWGDPNADYRVPDGGFHNLPLSYPSPHTVRRNFTLLLSSTGGTTIVNNASISESVIEAVLNTSPGHFKEFQTVVEVPGVRVIVGRISVSHIDVDVRAHTLPCTQSWAGKLFHYCVRFGASHLRRGI